MSNITQEEIEAWMRDIRLLSAHLSHPRDAEPVLPFDIGSRSEMRERLLKLSSLLKVMGCGLGIKKGQNEDKLKIMAQGRAFGTTKLEMK